MSQSKESPAGSALVADIDDAWDILDAMKDDASPIIKPRFDVLQRCFMRARDRISELESSGDAVEIGTLLALKSQFAAQQERIDALELELAQLRTPVGDKEINEIMIWLRDPVRREIAGFEHARIADVFHALARDRDAAQAAQFSGYGTDSQIAWKDMAAQAMRERDSAQARAEKAEAELAAIDVPEVADFLVATEREAKHQRKRWGTDHDVGKEPQDWFWLVGYLGGKCLRAHIDGDRDKALHHTISTAAACANWHAAILGKTNMQPGHAPSAALAAGEQRGGSGE